MKSTISPLNSRLDLRLAAYAAAGAAVATVAIAPDAGATVVYSGPTTITVPNNVDGIYLDLVTGATATSSASLPGFDVNPYGASGFSVYTPTTGGFDSTNGTAPAALALGTSIGPSSTFVSGAAAAPAFRVTGTEFMGLEFINDTTGALDYGWVEYTTTATKGFPATIIGYAYDNAGGSILAGQILSSPVPEPGTDAALGLGALALGAAGVRRWRQNKQVAA